MVRYKATISYDGRLFAGFQRQPSERSVQEELEKTLQKLNSGTPVKVHGAGRTDSGVHAYGQVVHFDLPQARDVEKLRFGLDTQSPEDIDVVDVELVSDDFHSRYNKHSKTVFTFSGNGFLYKQVRNMVGTLLKIGNGRMPVSQIKTVLESKNRDLAGPTAAGNGLYLKEIIYDE